MSSPNTVKLKKTSDASTTGSKTGEETISTASESAWSQLSSQSSIPSCNRGRCIRDWLKCRRSPIAVLGGLMAINGAGVIVLQAVDYVAESHLHFVAAGFWAGAWMIMNGLLGFASAWWRRKSLHVLFVAISLLTGVLVAAPLFGVSLAGAIADGNGKVVAEGDNYPVLQDNADEYQSDFINCTIQLDDEDTLAGRTQIYQVMCTNNVGARINSALAFLAVTFVIVASIACILEISGLRRERRIAAADIENYNKQHAALSWIPLHLLHLHELNPPKPIEHNAKLSISNSKSFHKRKPDAQKLNSLQLPPEKRKYGNSQDRSRKLKRHIVRRLRRTKTGSQVIKVYKKGLRRFASAPGNLDSPSASRRTSYCEGKVSLRNKLTLHSMALENSADPATARFADPVWQSLRADETVPGVRAATLRLPSQEAIRMSGTAYHLQGDNY